MSPKRDGPAGSEGAQSGSDRGGPGEDGLARAPTSPALPRGASSGRAEPSETERARRLLWIDRQKRRDALRVEVLTRELGLSKEDGATLLRAFAAALDAKVALYESLDPKATDRKALGDGLARIGSELEARLTEVLGPDGCAKYEALDKMGRFTLPEEHQKPKQP